MVAAADPGQPGLVLGDRSLDIGHPAAEGRDAPPDRDQPRRDGRHQKQRPPVQSRRTQEHPGRCVHGEARGQVGGLGIRRVECEPFHHPPSDGVDAPQEEPGEDQGDREQECRVHCIESNRSRRPRAGRNSEFGIRNSENRSRSSRRGDGTQMNAEGRRTTQQPHFLSSEF